MYQDLSMCHDRPLKKPLVVDLPIRLKGNSKCTSSSSLNLLRAKNKDIVTALQTLLTAVKLPLQCRLKNTNLS